MHTDHHRREFPRRSVLEPLHPVVDSNQLDDTLKLLPPGSQNLVRLVVSNLGNTGSFIEHGRSGPMNRRS